MMDFVGILSMRVIWAYYMFKKLLKINYKWKGLEGSFHTS